MLYAIDLDKIATHTNIDINTLKTKSYNELKKLEIEIVKKEKAAEMQQLSDSEEYKHIVRKYFEPYEYLRNWFTDEEIINACIACEIKIDNLTQKYYIPTNQTNRCLITPNEYLDTEWSYVAQYDRQGRELAERKYTECHMYRIRSNYQPHGKIILKLLYDRYPFLCKYKFDAYSFADYREYEIYPKNPAHIYTPFTALMTGDANAIIERNCKYAQSYNHGEYTPDACEQRLVTTAVKEYLDAVRSIADKS